MRYRIDKFEEWVPITIGSIRLSLDEVIEIGKKAQAEKDRRELNIKNGREWYE